MSHTLPYSHQNSKYNQKRNGLTPEVIAGDALERSLSSPSQSRSTSIRSHDVLVPNCPSRLEEGHSHLSFAWPRGQEGLTTATWRTWIFIYTYVINHIMDTSLQARFSLMVMVSKLPLAPDCGHMPLKWPHRQKHSKPCL